MTLIDLSRKIIFIKTHKTASTSVEAALEKSLLGLPFKHHHRFLVTSNGFVTARPKRYFTLLQIPFVKNDLLGLTKKYGWDFESHRKLMKLENHSLPIQIKEAVPDDFWKVAKKITICRNPVDIIFSQFFWENPRAKEAPTWKEDLNVFAQNIHPKPINQAVATMSEDITVLRYESLAEDLSNFLAVVGGAATGLPAFKSGYKPSLNVQRESILTAETIRAIRANWGSYASRFNYQI